MKKLATMEESKFLKLFFLFISGAFVVGAFFAPDRGDMLAGLARLCMNPSKLSTNCFDLGGFAATFLNMGLVGLFSTALFFLPGAVANNVSTLAVLLTIGFGSWGINVLNMWFSIPGVLLHCLVKKKQPGTMVNAMLFTTGLAPLISEMMLRYPGAEVGFSFVGALLALAVGTVIGFFLPAGLAHSPVVHKGFDHYSAALPIGMTAFALQGIFFKAPGVELQNAVTTLEAANAGLVNGFCLVLFSLCVLGAFAMGCKPGDYLKLLKDTGKGVSFSSKYGNAAFLMNAGVYGLMILAYYNLTGASFNAITFGLVFCMGCCCNSGSHPGNVWPIMLGYVAASYLFGWVSGIAGGTFGQAINAQAIAVGLCYASGLSPISGVYGWFYGMVSAMLHYCMVTTVPSLHGGFCLYNGGFTAALVCLLVVPCLEGYVKPKAERIAAKTK